MKRKIILVIIIVALFIISGIDLFGNCKIMNSLLTHDGDPNTGILAIAKPPVNG